MIEKIINIKNVGSYQNNICISNSGYWDGKFNKNNMIYAENGSGKTTLALLFRSLKNDNKLLKEKQTLGSNDPQKVKILINNDTYIFEDKSWDKHYSNIEIFDIHFIEDNVYIGSALPQSTKSNLFNIIVGEEGIKINKKLTHLYEQKYLNMQFRKKFRNKLKFNSSHLSAYMINDIKNEIVEYDKQTKLFTEKIKELNIELGEYSKSIFNNHIEIINKYLKFFTPNIELKKFSKKSKEGKQYVSYSLSVNGERVVFEKSTNSIHRNIKYTLSEGDKSAFAFSFFLAKLELQDITSKVIIFDDPISSFDQARRNATINQLMQIGQKSDQLFVLSHDIHFIKSIFSKCDKSTSNSLKITKRNNISSIHYHDIENETLSGIFKDIKVLNNYLVNGSTNELEKREIIRCIRPIIEGILRIKFFMEISKNEWLGDIIKKIRDATHNDKIYRLNKHLNEIIEINDYSKSFHHSDPTNPWGETINDEELRLYVNRTILLMDNI
jgi:wobble nucleotide-excising tRNase